MDTTGCARGYFSDHLFEIPDAVTRCTQLISVWLILVVVLILLRIAISVVSWHSWYVSYAKQTHTAVFKRKYYFGKRLPVVPFLVTLCAASSIVAWILASLAVVQFSTASSLLLLAIVASVHLILGSVSFIRFARIGQKILPLMRRRRLKRFNTPLTSKTAEEDEEDRQHPRDSREDEGSMMRRADSDAMDKTVQEGGGDESGSVSLKKRTESLEGGAAEVSDSNNGSNSHQNSATTVTGSTTAGVASGIYYYHVKKSGEGGGLAAIEEGVPPPTTTLETDAKSQIYPGSTLSHFSLPVRLLFLAQMLCSLGGCFAAFILGELDRESYGLSLGCYLMGSSRIIDGVVHFIQAGRTIALVKTLSLSTTTASSSEIAYSLQSISRQRNVTVLFDLIYSAILFVVAASDAIRGWYLFYALDCAVLAHNAALLVVHRLDLSARKVRSKKRDMMLRRQFTGNNLVQWWRDRPKAFWSSNNNNKQNKTSSLAQQSSVPEDAVPVPNYEEAWDKGFRWRRWSTGNEKKERRAFVAEYKKWLADTQKQNATMGGAATESAASPTITVSSPIFAMEAQRQRSFSPRASTFQEDGSKVMAVVPAAQTMDL